MKAIATWFYNWTSISGTKSYHCKSTSPQNLSGLPSSLTTLDYQWKMVVRELHACSTHLYLQPLAIATKFSKSSNVLRLWNIFTIHVNNLRAQSGQGFPWGSRMGTKLFCMRPYQFPSDWHKYESHGAAGRNSNLSWHRTTQINSSSTPSALMLQARAPLAGAS